MDELRMRCLELAISAGKGDPVAEADRYFQFVRGLVGREVVHASPVDAGGDVAVFTSDRLHNWSANNAIWSS